MTEKVLTKQKQGFGSGFATPPCTLNPCRCGRGCPPPTRPDDDLAHAIRLLHVLRSWSWTPGNVPDPAREDALYPAECPDGNTNRGQLWQAVDAFLKSRPYVGEPK